MRSLLFFPVVFLAACAFTASCQRDPLTYDTALNLLKDRNTEPVRLTFSTSVPASGDARLTRAYDKLIDAHVLTCTENSEMGKICRPGPSGETLAQSGSTELTFVAGRWVPLSIGSMNRLGGDTATAEVRMSFDPSPLYRDFETQFDQLEDAAGKPGLAGKKNGTVMHARFRKDEDGWHLESLND